MPIQKYDESFRAGALALAKQLDSIEDAAKQLNVTPSQLYKWRKAMAGEKKKAARRGKKPSATRTSAIALSHCPTCGAPVRLQYFNGKDA